MDPITQGTLGAAAPQAMAKRHWGTIALVGFLTGMTPDLDVLIQSPSDPLVFLEYHRQFTHSLVFIPIGGWICAAILYRWFAHRHLSFRETWLWATIGYATHGLLDSCTSYGTQLFWPFSTERIAWHNVSIIDPLFTAPLLAAVLATARWKRPLWVQLGLVWIVIYLLLGVAQRERAEDVGAALAAARGQTPVLLEAKPSFGNNLVWKCIYEYDGAYYIDAIRLSVKPTIYPGTVVPKLNVARDFPWLDPASQQARDIDRFAWFSSGFLALAGDDPNVIVDMRYSLLPHRGNGLWGIVLEPGRAPDAHVGYRVSRFADAVTREQLIAMLRGQTADVAPCELIPDDGAPRLRCPGT